MMMTARMAITTTICIVITKIARKTSRIVATGVELRVQG
jgi:hypothetical protein